MRRREIRGAAAWPLVARAATCKRLCAGIAYTPNQNNVVGRLPCTGSRGRRLIRSPWRVCSRRRARRGLANGQPATSPAASASLDYEFFKTKVEPVFLAKRPGHTRCVVCHTTNNAPFHLVPLSPGSTTWNEEQSRQNFELIQQVAAPGYEDSPLVKHPLAQEAGGDPHHGGGQQFASKQRSGLADIESIRDGSEAK